MKKILTCPECGQKNISKLKVCNRCGASLRQVESGRADKEYIETPETPETPETKAAEAAKAAKAAKEQKPPDADFSNLMNCPDCNREISKNAPNCPGCGAPIAKAADKPAKKGKKERKPAKKVKEERKQYGCGTLILVLLFGTVLMTSIFSKRDSISTSSTSNKSTVNRKSTKKPTAVDAAFAVCASLVESTDLVIDCEVEGWGSTVDVIIDTNSREAKKICATLVEVTATTQASFGGKWKLRIFSPFSGDRPIAVCTLR